MSMDPILWAMKDAPIADAEEWAILVCLAERADDDGCGAFPSQAAIAKRVKMADRTVRRRLEAMEERGLIGRGDQSLALYLKDRAPVVWDLLIPLTWFPNLERIQEFRERKNRPPLTAEQRPSLGPAPDKARRVDFGVVRTPDFGTGRTSSPVDTPDSQTGRTTSPGGQEVRADSETATTGLEGQSDRTTSPTNLKNKPSPRTTPSSSSAADATDQENSTAAEPETKKPRRDLNADRPEVDRLCNLLADLIQENDSDRVRPTVSKAWRDAARRMLDIDHRDAVKAENLIRWCQQDDFWAPNIRSMPTFREQYGQLQPKALADWRRKQAGPSGGRRERDQLDRQAARDRRRELARQFDQQRAGQPLTDRPAIGGTA